MSSATHKRTAGSRFYRKSKLEPVNCYADANFGSKLDKKSTMAEKMYSKLLEMFFAQEQLYFQSLYVHI